MTKHSIFIDIAIGCIVGLAILYMLPEVGA